MTDFLEFLVTGSMITVLELLFLGSLVTFLCIIGPYLLKREEEKGLEERRLDEESQRLLDERTANVKTGDKENVS